MKRITKRDAIIFLVCYMGGGLVGTLVAVAIIGLVS